MRLSFWCSLSPKEDKGRDEDEDEDENDENEDKGISMASSVDRRERAWLPGVNSDGEPKDEGISMADSVDLRERAWLGVNDNVIDCDGGGTSTGVGRAEDWLAEPSSLPITLSSVVSR
jgi:hypothetical protein